MERLLPAVTFISVLGTGLIAGVFFAFSSFVMGALGRLPAANGISAMQSINVVVLNPAFLGVFMGTAVLCLVLALSAIMRWSEPGAAYLLIGSTIYVLGTFAVTIALNVPLNDELAAVNAQSGNAANVWARYLTDWTMWNHVRTGASVIASACLIKALP
ncbi:MAG: hypothetical protein A4S14_18500 [Proteobacteria bacterium SG_bin9]|nr:MAG: hypothetical protein A4S14_18500 [Proteobacteria bacterium SG_bin9]